MNAEESLRLAQEKAAAEARYQRDRDLSANRPADVGYAPCCNQATSGALREMTVENLIDRRIEKLHLQMKALQDIKGSLSQSFLHSGASRISAVLEL